MLIDAQESLQNITGQTFFVGLRKDFTEGRDAMRSN